MICGLPFLLNAQKIIVPGSSDIHSDHLKLGKSIFTVYYVKDTSWDKKGTLSYDINRSGDRITFIYEYVDKNNEFRKKRTSMVESSSLKPISYKFEGPTNTFDLDFGESIVNGKFHYFDKRPEESVSVAPKIRYIDFNIADQFMTTLPLETGYKATFAQFFFNMKPDSAVTNYTIKEVKSYIYHSPRTGEHEAWLATVSEGDYGGIYNYIVDKKDHRLWQREMSLGNGMWEICVNEEIDYQPIASKFNLEQAKAQINNGNSVVTGVAFAKEKTGKALHGLINTAKKQYAPKGTEILIFPSSAYYEEWTEVNEKIRKKKKIPEVPLDPNFGYAIKKTTVYDNQGHFEFTNLMAGTYVVLASFDFTNAYNYTYVSGYTDYYNHWGYSGTTTNYGTAKQYYSDKANIEKRVTISHDGDKEDIKLKE